MPDLLIIEARQAPHLYPVVILKSLALPDLCVHIELRPSDVHHVNQDFSIDLAVRRWYRLLHGLHHPVAVEIFILPEQVNEIASAHPAVDRNREIKLLSEHVPMFIFDVNADVNTPVPWHVADLLSSSEN